MTRYFVAIPLPSGIRERLTLLRANLPNARWIEPEDLHLTLRFIGDCDGPTYSRIVAELDQISADPFELQLAGINFFGHDKPRSLWIGAAEERALRSLQQQVTSAIRRADIQPDGRKFTPHVTLARLSRTRYTAVAQTLEALGDPIIAPFQVEHFALYSSGRSRGGGPYAIDETFPFAESQNNHPED